MICKNKLGKLNVTSRGTRSSVLVEQVRTSGSLLPPAGLHRNFGKVLKYEAAEEMMPL